MADYIYLMQNRLTPAQWRALEAVRESARAHNMPVFLVGGAVRDLTSGSPVRDLDFAVQGDVRVLREEFQSRGGELAGENAVLASLYVTFRGGVRTEVGPTLTVSYPKPGKPETQPATILDDLRRRDFTANAMAVSLNEGSYGLLLDPLNGTADIENRDFRMVSPYGFIEQPALLLRAARLTDRLGWALEERTQSRYENSKQEGHIAALSAADRGYELEEVFHEEDPLAAFAHLESEGWREALSPTLRLNEAERESLDDLRELIGQMEGQGLHPDPSAVFFPLLTAKLSAEDRSALKAMFPRTGFVRQVETMETRSKELAAQLSARSAALPSDAWRLLVEADPEVVLFLAYHSRTGAVHNKIKAFLKDWPQMRQRIPYALMQEMRITTDLPGYDKLLDDLFFALIDGKLDTPEATRAFLEPYSPPAPPQVAVRRRPAKATRSRAKRVVEEPIEDVSEGSGKEEAESSSGEGASEPEDAELNDEKEEEEEQEPEAVPSPKVAAKSGRKAPQSPAQPPASPAGEASSSQATLPEAGRENVSAGKAESPAGVAKATETATAKAPARVAAKTVSKAVTPKPVRVPATPSGKVAPAPAARTAAPAKAAVKTVPKKSATPERKATTPGKAVSTKAPAKGEATKISAKGDAARRAAPPKGGKTPPKKALPVTSKSKTPAKKVAAKKQPAKPSLRAAKTSAPAKRSGAKPAKKSVPQRRGR